MGRNAWLLVVAIAISGGLTLQGETQGMNGNWRTATGSVVQVYACGDSVCLRLLQVEKTAPGTMDVHNPDAALRTRSLCGLQIGSGFHLKDGGSSAKDGTLYDPESGRTYRGVIATDGPDKLKLRGYVGIKLFGRTEEWTRVSGAVTGCRPR